MNLIQVEERAQVYLEAYKKLCKKAGDPELAKLLLHEIARDARQGLPSALAEKPRVIDGDAPATEKQRGYLKRLGIDAPEGLTKQSASVLIDEAKGAA